MQFFLSGAVVEPGDTLAFSRQGQKPLRVTVPNLTAGVNVAMDRVSGTAPPGATLSIVVIASGPDGTTLERSVTADAAGLFELNLNGVVDLQPGLVTGGVNYTTPDNHRFHLRLASLAGDITLGAGTLRGRATAGQMVAAAVRRGDGTNHDLPTVAATGDGTYVLPFYASDLESLTAGDAVTITTSGGPAGSDEQRAATLADLTIDLNPDTERVTGNGPADTALVISADDMDGQTASVAATIAADGTLDVSLADQIDLGPGWRVRAAYEAAPGLRVGALAVLRKVQLGVHMPISLGRAEPGQMMTVTLRSASGEVKAQQMAFVDDQGEYGMFFFGNW